ncbi:hypothetical protein [Nocardia fusca]|uniref:hypothetical protein n=1 Tax=Nocardia fusca TaxID=941183 RepID=UPI0012F4D9E4|nr:hypothetical protein [Nocardia fusca]
MRSTTREILRQIADTLGIEAQKVCEIITADYRGEIVHPLRKGCNLIVGTDFPFPGRLISWTTGVGPRPFAEENLERIAELRKFAEWQADTANGTVGRLTALDRNPTAEDWATEYFRVQKSRIEYNVESASTVLNRYLSEDLITDEDPNYDWFGNNILRHNAEWDGKNKGWLGGEPSLRSIIYDKTAERVLKRFRTEEVAGDELQNMVRLSDGTEVPGNRLLKDESAKRAAVAMKERAADHGVDVSKWEIPTDKEAITITATADARRRILQDAFEQLAQPGELTPGKWADVAYKLYQSPQTKAGSDSVIRTFLVGAAEYRMGRVPVFPHDIDLRAYTMNQSDFVKCVVEGTFERLLLPSGIGV